MPRKITPEFKCECAELVITHGSSHKDVAVAMSVGLHDIGKSYQELHPRSQP
ncbi:transposase [Vibrio parahaemolyticus]|uniref:transposase n=1 Tax=Vibrio parahaemolyticus TaxID=670 RepID=UPI00186A4E15|nr:transposase [Vibrio parahaemolyticus]MBE4089905.1 transposase [Vibrio parahaemolyticus]MCQ9092002.1 transposase [Vibrio parahaemolyticus]